MKNGCFLCGFVYLLSLRLFYIEVEVLVVVGKYGWKLLKISIVFKG